MSALVRVIVVVTNGQAVGPLLERRVGDHATRREVIGRRRRIEREEAVVQYADDGRVRAAAGPLEAGARASRDVEHRAGGIVAVGVPLNLSMDDRGVEVDLDGLCR